MSANESEVLQANKRVANRPWVAVVVALFTALLAAGLWYYSTSVIEQRTRDRFLYRVDMAERISIGRMNDFQQVLRGRRGCMPPAKPSAGGNGAPMSRRCNSTAIFPAFKAWRFPWSCVRKSGVPTNPSCVRKGSRSIRFSLPTRLFR